jgi:phosphoribosyl 1,2-cyclic phosphodiesterase
MSEPQKISFETSLFPELDAEKSNSAPSKKDTARNELELNDSERNIERQREKLIYISFASGSSGNACYIGTKNGGIVVDAGIPADDIEVALKKNNISMKSVRGLLLTHDHSDHVRYSYNLLRKNKHLSLYCTPRVLNGLLRRHSISKRIKEYHVPIFKEIPFKVGDFEVTAFDVPHDGSDNMGFSIDYKGRHFVLATDLGEVTERARYYMSSANYLVIEANYDAEMLRVGKYPEYLKARISAGNGHLDNVATAAFLKEIVNPDLEYIFLCHLSQDNNTPDIALKTVREALESKGLRVGAATESAADRRADIQLMALPRFEPTRCFTFRFITS